MKTDLNDTLGARADRVDANVDVDAFLRDVHERVETIGRRRRNTLAAGGGVVAVVALVAATISLTSTGSDDNSNRQPVGGEATVSASPAPTSADPAAASRAAARTAAAQAVLARAQAEAAARARGGRLVPIGAAPAKAPLSVSLAPKGWHYLASGPASVLYGPRNTPNPKNPNVFSGRLALLVGMRYQPDGPLPLTVGPYRGSFDAENGDQSLYLAVNKKISVTIQVPAKAHLSRAEVIDLGKTLDVRDISHPSSG